jgi:hypothetical protein
MFITHITFSLGWVGAVIAFLALAVIGITSDDERTARGAYLVMAPAAWFVLVPLAHASLLSGIALSLGTTWGLFRYYWVVLKLVITVFATVILSIYMATFRHMAGVAADPLVDVALVRHASPIIHASLACILLLAATVLGVYKPWGMTAYGRRQNEAPRYEVSSTSVARPQSAAAIDAASTTPRGVAVFGIIAVGMVLLFVFLHFIGNGLRH